MTITKESEIKHLSDCAIEQVGYKVMCYACNGSYYDLGKEDPICPYCKTQLSKAKKQRGAVAVAMIPADTTDETVDDEFVDDEDDID